MSKLIAFFVGCFILSFIPTHNAHAATFNVCTLAELTTAITTANTNNQADTINFNCSTTLNFTSEFTLLDDGAGNGITINSNGNTVIFDGGGSTRFFTVDTGASLTLNGFTLQNGNNAGSGGAITNSGTMTITNSTFTNNSANGGGAIGNGNTATITNSTFTGNSANYGGAIFGANSTTISNSTFIGNSAVFVGGAVNNNIGNMTINASIFQDNISPLGAAFHNNTVLITTDSYYENNGCSGPRTDNGGNTVVNAPNCPGTAPVIPVVIATPVTVLGCALDTADGLEIANAPDDTYCRVLMKNGGVVGYSGAVPANLIQLGVILAVDVYRLEGGMSVNTFPNYAQVCLAGSGRLFYMDSRNAPRVSIELASETVDGLTCGWIPAPGTLILTN